MKVWVSCSVVSDCLWPHGPWPAWLLYPWNFPGKDTGVGCHFLLWGTTENPDDWIYLWLYLTSVLFSWRPDKGPPQFFWLLDLLTQHTILPALPGSPCCIKFHQHHELSFASLGLVVCPHSSGAFSPPHICMCPAELDSSGEKWLTKLVWR